MNKIDQIFSESDSIAEFAAGYSEYLSQLLKAMDFDAIERFTRCLLSAREEGRTIFFIGNGGSAATASHFANDLGIGTRCSVKPFRAVSLTDNVAVLTAIGNDFGYDQLFVKQLELVLRPSDIIVAISASGNSPNILKAVEFGKRHRAYIIGLTGFDGGRLREICDLSLHVRTARGEYGPVEDVHMFLDHLVASYLIRLVSRETTLDESPLMGRRPLGNKGADAELELRP